MGHGWDMIYKQKMGYGWDLFLLQKMGHGWDTKSSGSFTQKTF